MTAPPHDAIVVGLGAMGSAAACHLAGRGARVLAFDQLQPPHDRGSSHGRSRIIREAYFEHPCYVPLVQRAYELWDELARAAGERLFIRTGGLMVGPPEGMLVAGALASARAHALPHEVLDAAAVERRFPALRAPSGFVGVLEPRAGVLLPERCIEAHLALARARGAELRPREGVRAWHADTVGVQVTTDRATYSARQLVVTAGAWLGTLCPALAVPLTIERQLLHWLEPEKPRAAFGPEHVPVALWEWERDRIFYTFPDLGDGVKVGIHHDGETTAADAERQPASERERVAALTLARRFLPRGARRVVSSVTCVYTNTPDSHFVIDRHPAHPPVLIVSACSGHGFKFSSTIGEIVADLVTSGATRHDLTPFRLDRPALTGGR